MSDLMEFNLRRVSGASEKRYYVNKIRGHMVKIHNEIENLRKSSAENKRSTFWLEEDKVKAKRKAKVYCDLENELTLLNIVLQMNLTRYGYEKVLTDILALKRSNENVLEKLEEFFEFKQHLEELSNNLKRELEQKKASPEKCPMIIEVEIEKIKEAVAGYRRASDPSFFRTKRRQLLLELDACNARRADVLKECDPDIVLKALRQDKEEIKVLEANREQLELDLKQLKVDAETIENIEASPATGESINKFEDALKAIHCKENDIKSCLDYLLVKWDKSCEFFEASASLNITSKETFLQLLQNFGSEFQKQLEELTQTLHEKKCTIKKYEAMEDAMEELSEKGMQLEEQKKSLKIDLASMTTAVEGLKERLKETKWLLARDSRYMELQASNEELKGLEQENLKLEERFVLENCCKERNELSKEIDGLTRQYNEKLIRRLKGKFT